ncbi:unnamed protein product [marine sediment metagenome]|uniref:Uncharacterized protein n=1 Tax=marine sediment metagenome TaxID=412755 RepID=X0WZW4_9ZZZZ
MSQSKEVHKEYMRKRRGSQTLVEIPSKGSQDEGSQDEGSQVHPAIIRAITDSKVRPKIEKISQELNAKGLGKDVRYGIDGPTFDIVAKLLEVTR